MRPRPAVLLTPSESVRLTQLPSCKQIASFYPERRSVSPLFAALAKSAHLYHSKPLRFPLFSYTCALFCTFLHFRKPQPFFFQSLPHSASKNTTTRGEGKGTFSCHEAPHGTWRLDTVKTAPSSSSASRQSQVTRNQPPRASEA